MAACSSSWNEAVLRWNRVAELGMEVALREAGCSEQIIVATLSLFDNHDRTDFDPGFDLGKLEGMTDPELARAATLATLARGDSHIDMIFGSAPFLTANEAAALCVNLSSNSNMSRVSLCDNDVLGTMEVCEFVGNALATNSSLQRLALIRVGMGSDGVRGLLHGLQSNKTLECLILNYNPLLDEGLSSVAEFMITNTTIKQMYLYCTGCSLEGATQISSILVKNSTLQILFVGEDDKNLGREAMKRLLEPLSLDVRGDAGTSSSSSNNTSLKALYLHGITPECVDCVSHMIRTNKSLREARLRYGPVDPTDWKEKILPAVQQNDTLVRLSFNTSAGLVGDALYESLMDWLQNSNTQLESLDLSDTGLESRQGQINEELRINKEYRYRLRGQPQITTTSGRAVLCGYAFGGKTEISKTVKRIDHGTPFTHPLKMVYKKLMQSNPTLRRTLLGRDAHKELTTRTRGFQVVILQNRRSLKSIWDFAGQKEYYALHDYVFPNVKNSYFLYVCSCRHPPDDSHLKGRVKDEPAIRRECEYWLRFLASNSKRAVRNDASRLPRVRFVLTKTDTLHPPHKVISETKNVVSELKGVFQDVLNLCQDVEVVNSHSSRDVQRLLTTSSTNLDEMLKREKEYNICDDVRNLLAEWSRRNLLKPVLRLEEFYKLCEQSKLDFNQLSEDGWKIVLAYLNDLGEIVFSKDTDFIVTNPSWFGIDVLGSLINACKGADSLQTDGSKLTSAFCSRVEFRGLYHRQGFVERQYMKAHLECSLHSMHLKQSIPAENLIELMIQLEMCFQVYPEGTEGTESPTKSLFMPALFDDEKESAAKGERMLKWGVKEIGPFEFLGRRLECRDRVTTFFTPGFFPRLQVHLRNYIDRKGWTKNLGFGVDRNLIRFTNSGIVVCVEYAGDTDDFIDILVRSSESHEKAENFVEKHVVQTIRTFCASPQGCQGVDLVESVIRPVCVRNLHLCVNRKPHAVLVTELRDALAEDDAYKHTWSERIEDVSDTDRARDLLEGEGSYDRICGKGQVGLALPTSNSTAIESSGTDGLPRLIYPTTERVGLFRRLETKLNLNKHITIKLHVLCDHKDGPHKVAEQPGRTVRLNTRDDCYGVPIVKLAVTLVWAGVRAGASMFGASVGVPQVDKFIDELFSVPEMPGLDGETIHHMMSPAHAPGPVSEQEILKALARYWKVDPHSQGLKEILKLEDDTSFKKHFKLHKVEYTKGAHAKKIAWVCVKHFKEGISQQSLRSVPH